MFDGHPGHLCCYLSVYIDRETPLKCRCTGTSSRMEYRSLKSDYILFIRDLAIEGWIVSISGIHEELTEEELSDKLSDFGEVKNLHLNLDWRTGYAKVRILLHTSMIPHVHMPCFQGYALVEYETYESAKSCIEHIHGSLFLNKTLKADFAFIKGEGESKSFLQPSRKCARNPFCSFLPPLTLPKKIIGSIITIHRRCSVNISNTWFQDLITLKCGDVSLF